MGEQLMELPTAAAPNEKAVGSDDPSHGESRVGEDIGRHPQLAQAGAVQSAQAQGAAQAIGSVNKAEGTVSVSRASGGRETLGEGDPIYQGDQVETGADSALGLVFVDGTTFELGGGAAMVLDELIYDPGGGVGSFVSNVLTGTFVFVSGAVAATAPEAMQVKTPAGTIGVRGTAIACSSDGAAGVCSKVSQDGGFRFFNDTDSANIVEQFETVFSPGLTGPLASSVLGPAAIVRLYGALVQAYVQETEVPEETEAGPVVFSSGGIFLEANLDDLLLLLKSSGVIGQVGSFSTLEFGTSSLPADVIPPATAIGSAVSVEEESDGGALITGAISGIPGGAGVKLLGLIVTANGTPNSLSAGGEPVLFDISDDGQTLTGFLPPESDGGERRTVFSLQLDDSPLGAFSFLLERPLDHVDPNASGPADTIELIVQVLVSSPGTDPTGISDADAAPVNAVTQIVVVVNDSAPNAIDETTVVTEETGDLTSEDVGAATIMGNVLPNDDQGADGPAPGGPLVSFAYSGGIAAAGSTVTTDNGGLLTVNSDGSWSYLPPVNVDTDLDDGFTYTVQDFDGDSSSGRQSIIVTDDSTNETTSPAIASADLESKLPGGSDPDPDGVVAVIGELGLDFGKDQESVQITDIELEAQDQDGNSIALADLTSGGSALAFEETTGSRTLTAFFAEGPRAGQKVFELTVDEDGNSAVVSEEGILISIDGPFFRFELFASIDHSVVGATGPDDTLTLVFSYTASAGGDSGVGAITISLLDDGPAVIANEDRSVQESALPGASGADLDATTQVSGVLGFFGGADSAVITAVSVDGLAGVLDLSTGEIVVNGGFYLFRVDVETGAYSYELTGPASHPDGALPADSLVQTVSYSVTDGDRDPIVGTLQIVVDDDGPIARADTDEVGEGGPDIMGNVLTGEEFEGDEPPVLDPDEADSPGADGAARIAQITDQSTGTTYSSESGTFDASTGVVTITTAIGGSLAIVIEQVPSGDPLGKYTYSPPASGPDNDSGVELFDYLLEDRDGSTDDAILSITIVPADPILVVGENVDDVAGQATDHRIANPDGAPDGAIIGGNGEDALIGDAGGSVATTKSANIALSLDTSGSMGQRATFDGARIRKIRALDKSVEALIDDLIASDATDVVLHLISFDTTVNKASTFNIVSGGMVNTDAVTQAKAFILAIQTGQGGSGAEEASVAGGDTNYEAGYQAALNFFNSVDRLVDADVNQTILISDGGPNRFLSGNDTLFEDIGARVGSAEAISHVLGSLDDVDDVSEVQALLDLGSTVDTIGLGVVQGSAEEGDLRDVDADGDVHIVTSSDELAAALLDLSTVFDLDDVGGDSISGGPDDDLIFGDAVFTDLVSQDADILSALSQGAKDALASLPEGSSWAVIEELVNDGFLADTQAVIGFLRDPTNIATYDFGRESELNGETRAGGSDVIDGGAGNDILFGQEGDDTILDGSGADIVSGGSGADTIVLSADGESDRLLYGSLSEAGDNVSGFDAGAPVGGGDLVDIADLLDGTGVATLQDALDGGFLNLTDVGGNTAIGVDVNGTNSFTTLVTLEGIGVIELDDNIVVV